jgi:hypothetical protein
MMGLACDMDGHSLVRIEIRYILVTYRTISGLGSCLYYITCAKFLAKVANFEVQHYCSIYHPFCKKDTRHKMGYANIVWVKLLIFSFSFWASPRSGSGSHLLLLPLPPPLSRPCVPSSSPSAQLPSPRALRPERRRKPAPIKTNGMGLTLAS